MEDAKADQQITIVGPVGGAARSHDRYKDVIENTVDVSHVRNGYVRFMESLRSIIDVPVPLVGSFELEEVTFSAEISADGEFKLLGTGVGIAASSGVSFTLRRAKGVDAESG